MSKQEKKGLVPTLRFPEFQDDPRWDEDTLIRVAKFRRGSFPQPYGLPEWYDEVNGMPFVQVFDVDDDLRLKSKTKRKISRLGAEQSIFIPKETVIITIQGSIGRVAITQYDAYVDRTLLLFEEFLRPLNKIFFAYVLQQLFEIEKQKAPGGIIKTITKEVLSDFKIKIPRIAEQQKIADCLTSIDELITAQTQKLDALKTHKKGLMQQLFPAEGETVPKLRFSEFRDAGEWEEKKLSSMAQLISGLHLSPDQYSNKGTTPYFTGPSDFTDKIQNVSKWTEESTSIARENDILITVKGSGVGEILYLSLPRVAIGRQLMAVRSTISSSRFIYQFLLTKRARFEDLASGNLIPGLSRGDILELEARFPSPPEQQKIANCLVSIDELIIAQTQKLDALKAHKKGLMQQLFPSVGGVAGEA